MMLEALTCFIGYFIGRLGHVYGGQLKGPHHWIYGVALIIIGWFYSIYILSLGIGVFISDLRDFIKGRFYGVDEPGRKKFWGID